jgi:hypothetical protein
MLMRCAGLIFATLLMVSPSAHAEEPNLTGTWNMGLQGGHVIPTPLVLTQDGKSLSGTIGIPTQNFGDRIEVKLTGEVVDRAFKLTGTVEGSKDGGKNAGKDGGENASKDGSNDKTTIAIDGTILEDGTLEGHVDFPPHGTLPWTAERLKERK